MGLGNNLQVMLQVCGCKSASRGSFCTVFCQLALMDKGNGGVHSALCNFVHYGSAKNKGGFKQWLQWHVSVSPSCVVGELRVGGH